MAIVESLYDALIKTKVKEDQSTYFLVWLIKFLPEWFLKNVFEYSGLETLESIEYIGNKVQYV
ncbi:MAG: hypothetical protein V1904_13915, partial [Bacteroidota bacterium]